MSKFFEVNRMTNGEIRVQADLFGEEISHGVVIRGFNDQEAIAFAAELLKAAGGNPLGKLEETMRRIAREEMSKVLDEARAKAEVPEYIDAEKMSDAFVAIVETLSEKASIVQVNRHEDTTDHNQS